MADGKVNTKARDIKIECTDSKKNKLYDFLDKKLILYFYPKDMTPGCTTESIEFNTNLAKIKKLGANIVGVSRDKMSLHEKFIEKHGFKFPLISDPEEKLCKSFDVIKEKSLYGRKYMGVDRSTFIISQDGKILHAWRNVKVKGHVDEVIEKLREYQ
ncbi:MAG: peroxiredoxin [Gammaproteobacteria bacterium]|jgi:peroxiredoxin Q/BCP|tara:strand:- start:2875 stop:3345 length:471 start_codon:yes stop_codon:yes gene_type:complete